MVIAQGTTWGVTCAVDREMLRRLKDPVIVSIKEMGLYGLESGVERGEVEGFLTRFLHSVQDV